jgi:glycosyltransferase involved in cell wall biosynthesis
MKVLFIFNGIVKNGGVVSVSGGDIRLLEIMKYAKDVDTHLLTTPNGLEFLKKYDQSYKKAYIINQVVEAGILSNLKITIKALFFGKTGVKAYKGGAVYSSCEHIYDVLPALRLKVRNKCRWYAVYHWVEDYPWREKRGNTPLLSRYAYWANRYVAGWLIKHFADEILAVSDQTKDKLVSMKHIRPEQIRPVYCGVEYDRIQDIVNNHKEDKGESYDAVFMKRLNYGKGVLDLLKIWKEVVAVRPNARLGIIGDGSDDIISKINSFIKKHGMEENVDLLGVIYDVDKKFRILNSSKIFLLPTHEENWAIVIGEAMASGVPVIASRLKEITPIWKDNVVWCGVGDIKAFAAEVLRLLGNPKDREILSKKARSFILRYDWKQIANDEFGRFKT